LPDEGNALTIRAVLVGTILGSVVAASNLYLGLKTGFTFGASLFGAIFGFAILKPLSRAAGGYFGPKENCTVQTAATAAGGLSTLFVAALPAMYRLKLLGEGPEKDIGKIIALTFITAYYGLFFAVPLRRYFILKKKLVFPSPFASANTIASLHSVGGESEGLLKAKIMGWSLVGALLWNIFGYFFPGVYSWDIFSWLAALDPKGCPTCVRLAQWTWYLEWTPAFFGAGMLSGLHVSVSMWIGSWTAWGIGGPLLLKTGQAVRTMSMEKFWDPFVYGDEWANKDERIAPGPPGAVDAAKFPSARYWFMWPGIMVMVCASFAELFYNWRGIWDGLKGGAQEIIGKFTGAKRDMSDVDEDDSDPAPADQQVKPLYWVGGLLISSVTTVLVLSLVFKVHVGEAILSIILAFLFGFIGIQASGQTDINPVGSIAKTSQFIFGGISRGQGKTEGLALADARRTNLLAGAVAGGAASQCVDMVGDLKTGHLLRASPLTQFLAQSIGTFFAVFISTGLYVVYSKAYPCINVPMDECPFELPSVLAWQKIAEVLTAPENAIPKSAAITSIVMGIVAVFAVILRHKLPAKHAWLVPNFSAIGIAWILNTTSYSNAMVLGALIMTVWEAKSPASWAVWGFALSSGLIAGEGLGGLVQAI
ncbi:OPT oligopeptide transporter protein-domain-containing protein, partial [Gaertneriomyces semiglobifer]